MADNNKTTENSKVELSEEDLDAVQGGYTSSDGQHKGGTPERVPGTRKIGGVVDHKADDVVDHKSDDITFRKI